MIHRHVFHNDQLLPIEKVRLSPGQAGLICGWGLFTTLRIVRGEAFAFERHWRRLEKDAAITWDHIARSPNCSIRKAQRLLDYQPRYSSLEAVQESLNWLIAHGTIQA